MDKDRIDIILGIDPIVEREVNIIMVGIEETIRTVIIMEIEIIDLEMKVIKPTIIDKVTGPIIEGIMLTKMLAKEIETDV